MPENRRNDVVSMTAIVAGAVVGVVATAASLSLNADVSHAPVADPGMEAEAVTESTGVRAWTDPRGPERGPDELEWEVIRTYKRIESMTATEPSRDEVDATLQVLRAYANRHSENPYIQELYLKGLRVAEYYAADLSDETRQAVLQARFRDHAARFPEYESVGLESMQMIAQRLGRGCEGIADAREELRRLAERFPSERADVMLNAAIDGSVVCAEGSF